MKLFRKKRPEWRAGRSELRPSGVLRERGVTAPHELCEEAAQRWLYMNDQQKGMWRAEFKTVDLSLLDKAADILREKLGLSEETPSD